MNGTFGGRLAERNSSMPVGSFSLMTIVFGVRGGHVGHKGQNTFTAVARPTSRSGDAVFHLPASVWKPDAL